MPDWREVNQDDGPCDDCEVTIPAGERVRFSGDNLCLTCAERRRDFDGAVHVRTNADIGHNRQGDEVVRIDLFCPGAKTTTILSANAATALRNALNRLLDDDGETEGLVDASDACPSCGEYHQDSLVWQDDGRIHCTNCGTRYDADAKHDAASEPQ